MKMFTVQEKMLYRFAPLITHSNHDNTSTLSPIFPDIALVPWRQRLWARNRSWSQTSLRCQDQGSGTCCDFSSLSSSAIVVDDSDSYVVRLFPFEALFAGSWAVTGEVWGRDWTHNTRGWSVRWDAVSLWVECWGCRKIGSSPCIDAKVLY